MTVNWADVLHDLRSCSGDAHRIHPPCAESRIATTERELGNLPNDLLDMLKHLNGAMLFDSGGGGELVTIFGISGDSAIPTDEWPADWYVDKFTPKWRAAGTNRENEWAIAMMNYGELVLLDGLGTVRKWDTSQRRRNPETVNFDRWLYELLREGAAYLNE
jgi:hypothetical protein